MYVAINFHEAHLYQADHALQAHSAQRAGLKPPPSEWVSVSYILGQDGTVFKWTHATTKKKMIVHILPERWCMCSIVSLYCYTHVSLKTHHNVKSASSLPLPPPPVAGDCQTERKKRRQKSARWRQDVCRLAVGKGGRHGTGCELSVTSVPPQIVLFVVCANNNSKNGSWAKLCRIVDNAENLKKHSIIAGGKTSLFIFSKCSKTCFQCNLFFFKENCSEFSQGWAQVRQVVMMPNKCIIMHAG